MLMTEIQIYQDYVKNGKNSSRIKALAEVNDTTMENIREIIMNQSKDSDNIEPSKPKKKAGRPKGSKNKEKIKNEDNSIMDENNEIIKDSDKVLNVDMSLESSYGKEKYFVSHCDDATTNAIMSVLGPKFVKGYCIGSAFKCMKEAISKNDDVDINKIKEARDYLDDFIHLLEGR